MSILHITSVVLQCDGCGARFDAQENSITARAVAHGSGWRFPSKINTKGQPTASTSDVCPECQPTWTPLLDGKSKLWTEEQRRRNARQRGPS